MSAGTPLVEDRPRPSSMVAPGRRTTAPTGRDAGTRLVVVVGRPVPGNRHDSRGWEESGSKPAVGNTMTIADGSNQGTGLVIPHRRRKGEELSDWKEEHNRSHKQVRARVEHVFARMKAWKILRDCRLKGDGVHTAMLGIARLHNLALTR